jgi:hypothetical protein
VGDEDEPPIQRDGTPAALDRDLAEDFARRQGLTRYENYLKLVVTGDA